MKKTFFLFVTILSLFLFNSCRSDGDWGNNQTNGQFGFTVERDTDFIEKAVGETNDLKLNIKPNYKFEASKMYIKYTGDKNGVLKMDSITLEQNKEYEVKKTDNILKYTANEEGTHKLKVILTNDKKQSVTEVFELKYGISGFLVKLKGGNGDFYQGQEISYLGEITPTKNTDTKGYSIKFNSFDGNIRFNGDNVKLGKEYPINDISNFTITTLSTKVGQSKLSYTIKNTTVSRDLDIQQNILARTITFDGDVSISKNVVEPYQLFSLRAVIKKSPKVSGTLFYKTWISGQNVDTDGITTTNGIYQQYTLAENNQLTLDFQAFKPGNYTLNIQLKDEFGNESEIRKIPVQVGDLIEAISQGTIKVYIARNDRAWIGYSGISVKNIIGRILQANNFIQKIEVNIKFTNSNTKHVVDKKYVHYYKEGSSSFELAKNFVEEFKTNNIGNSWGMAENVSSSIILTDNKGNIINFPHEVYFSYSNDYIIPN